MRASVVWFSAVCGLAACTTKGGDPPPPASSGTVVPAPPNATGAVAAGRASALPPSPLGPDEAEEELDEDGQPPLPLPVEPDDGGLPL